MLAPSVALAIVLFVVLAISPAVSAGPSSAFNGVGDYETDAYGYYYVVTGGQFPTGTIPNGDYNSGGTFRYITDDPAWNQWYGPSSSYSIDTWHKDGWFPQNAGLALTLWNNGSTVYDNNGIENGTYGNYYNAVAQGTTDANTPGLYEAYSMSNNFDWVYAGYFAITAPTTINQITGYFDPSFAGFDYTNPNIGYRMNIWSNVTGDLLPTNTGSFAGDVFSSDSTPGSFSISDTGVQMIYNNALDDTDYAPDDIYRLTYTLNTPMTLQPGVYWFSHDAIITPVPGAALLGFVGLGLVGLLKKRFAKKSA
jgi:hypothetical protein